MATKRPFINSSGAVSEITSADTLLVDGAVVSANTSVGGGNAALRITQTGTDDCLRVEDSANPDSTPFVIDASGNLLLGYGTSTASMYATVPIVQEQSGSGIAFYNYSAGSSGARLDLVKSRNAVRGSHTVVQSGDILGNILFGGSDGTAFIEAARIAVASDGTPGTNDMPGRLVFSTTANGAAGVTERMRIDNAGNVCFGSAGTVAGRSVRLSANLTGSVDSTGFQNVQAIQSDVTSSATTFSTSPSTSASAFTLNQLRHFYASQGTIGAGSAITTQYGFLAESTLSGAGTNYGFFSNIASASTNWGFYSNGTAKNYFNGKVLIGSNTDATADKVQVTGDVKITGNLTVTGSSSVAGQGGGGGFSLKYSFDTGTGGSPASGNVQMNNATPGSATLLYINETDGTSVNADAFLDDIEEPDWIMISNADRSKFHVFQVQGLWESGASVDPIPVVYMFGTATNFSASETVFISRSAASPDNAIGQGLMTRNSRYVMWG